MDTGPNEIWSADLIDMREFSNENKDYNYLLNVITQYLVNTHGVFH